MTTKTHLSFNMPTETALLHAGYLRGLFQATTVMPRPVAEELAQRIITEFRNRGWKEPQP